MYGALSIVFLNDKLDLELFAVFQMYFSVFVVYLSGSNGCQSLEELLGVYNPCPRLSDLWHQTEIEKLKKL